VNYCIWSVAFCGAENWDISGSGSEILAKFWNVELEKDGEDQVE